MVHRTMAVVGKFLVAFIALITTCSCQQKLTNIDYLGLGYDAVFGNPHSDLHDPGFRDAVFQLLYSTNAVSSDGKWLVPDNVQALQTFGCGYETDTTVIHGTSSYSDSLAIDASVEVSGWFFSFSASTDYSQVRKGTSMYRRSYVSSVAKCLLYHASIKRLVDFKVTDEFFRAVAALPTTKDDPSYLRFISVFGTHYASSLDMGSKAVLRSEFEQTAWTTLERTNFDFKTAAHASFLGFAGGLKFSTETTKELASSFDGNRTSMTASYMGCRPSSDGKWETWMDSTGQSPYPIAYVLRPLTEVLTNQYFPNISASSLAAKRSLLNDSYHTYCLGSPGCVPPEADRVPVRLDQQKAATINTKHVRCRPGFSLLSCGIGNLDFSTSSESKRCAIPFDNTTCECYAVNGLYCQPWCANTVQNFAIKSSSFTKGEFRVDCPAQSKVIGCGIDGRASQGDDWDKAFYPSYEGSGCKCYANNGAQCYATCATNIRNHEILSQYGRGNITVQCSPNNFVLGCGLQPLTYGSAEQFRTHFVTSINSCQCYDHYGATCYAICGQFS